MSHLSLITLIVITDRSNICTSTILVLNCLIRIKNEGSLFISCLLGLSERVAVEDVVLNINPIDV